MANFSGEVRSRQPALVGLDSWQWILIAIVVVVYAATVTPGHVFGQDDFAAYLMHAANLVEGRPYTAINYVPNPDALWIAPSHGYPPVYPLLLAPVYKLLGFNFRALKVLTVLCFGGFLAAHVSWLKSMLPASARLAAVLVVAGNLVFWEQRDWLLSEFPYLMFSFGALCVADRVYQDLDPLSWRFGDAVLLSFLLSASYGTRTIGVALFPALVLADVCKFTRPSRFVIGVIALTTSLIVLQSLFLISPRAYVEAARVSIGSFFEHGVFYSKTLSYVWQNGYSKAAQIAFALIFTVLAASSFLRRLWNRHSVAEFYVLIYVAVLVAWTAEIGLRGLLPILPLYFAYGLEQFVKIASRFGRTSRAAFATLLFAIIAVTYLGVFRWNSRQGAPRNVLDRPARELFSFLRANTQSGDVLVFQHPRTLALFTNRPVTTLDPNQPADQSARFLATVHAKIFVQDGAIVNPPGLATSKYLSLVPIFSNASFSVFRIDVRP